MFADGMILLHFFGRHFLWTVHLYDFITMVLYAGGAFGLGRLALKLRFCRFLPTGLPSAILVGFSLTTFLSAVLSQFYLFFLMRYVVFVGVGTTLISMFRYIKKKRLIFYKKVRINWAMLSYVLLVVLFLLVVIDQASRRRLNDDDDLRGYVVAPVVLAHTNTLPVQPFNYRETMFHNGGTGLFAPMVLMRDNPQGFIYLDVILGFLLIALMLKDYYRELSNNKYPYLLFIPLVIVYSFVTLKGTVNTRPVVLAMALVFFCLPKVRGVLVGGSRWSAIGLGGLLGTATLWGGQYLIVVMLMVIIVLIFEIKPSEWRKDWLLGQSKLVQQVLWIGAGGLIVYAPWMFHKWIHYGTLFYPVLGRGNYTPDIYIGRIAVFMKARFFDDFILYLNRIGSFFWGNHGYVLDWFLIIGFPLALFYSTRKKDLVCLFSTLIGTTLALFMTIAAPYWERPYIIVVCPFVLLLFVSIIASLEKSIKMRDRFVNGVLAALILIVVIFSVPFVAERYKNALSGKSPEDIYKPITASIYYNKTLPSEYVSMLSAIDKYISKGSTILYSDRYASFLPHKKYNVQYSDGIGYVGIKEISSIKDASELREVLVKRGIRYWIECRAPFDLGDVASGFKELRDKYPGWLEDIQDWERFIIHNAKLYLDLKKLETVRLVYKEERGGMIYDLNPD